MNCTPPGNLGSFCEYYRDHPTLLVLSVLFTKDTLVRAVVLLRLLASRMTPEAPTGLWLTVLGLNQFPTYL